MYSGARVLTRPLKWCQDADPASVALMPGLQMLQAAGVLIDLDGCGSTLNKWIQSWPLWPDHRLTINIRAAHHRLVALPSSEQRPEL